MVQASGSSTAAVMAAFAAAITVAEVTAAEATEAVVAVPMGAEEATAAGTDRASKP
jgi:hypothetical protein